MAKYIVGDKVITTNEWNNGMGRIIPKGSIVSIISIGGKAGSIQFYNCLYRGEFALYEEGWLGEKINTNADCIRAMNDEELAEFIKHISHNCLMNALFSVNDEDCKHYEDCESCREAHETVKEWLQSEAE